MEKNQQPLGFRIAQTVIDCLGVLARTHQPLFAKLGEMLRKSRLTERNPLTKLADREFALLCKIAENQQPKFVGDSLQQASRVPRLSFEGSKICIHEL